MLILNLVVIVGRGTLLSVLLLNSRSHAFRQGTLLIIRGIIVLIQYPISCLAQTKIDGKSWCPTSGHQTALRCRVLPANARIFYARPTTQ
ncbi:hypothetical protein FJTKL_03943 [Diaporthe vaccinii]|uniref:Secreted protein n=1 Tax=Diaporthe vaccinii TaxID=105482 RepID=A0ABR4F1M2_9PEZI